MKKTPKPSPEFDTFTGFMDKLAKVPHGELKAKLDAEKAEKQANDWVKRESQKHVRTGGTRERCSPGARRTARLSKRWPRTSTVRRAGRIN